MGVSRSLFYYYYHYFMLKYSWVFYYYYHYLMLKYSWVFLVSPCYCSTLVCSGLLSVSPRAVYWSWCCACLSLRLWLRGLWQPCCCSESRQRSEDQRSSGSDGKGKHTPVFLLSPAAGSVMWRQRVWGGHTCPDEPAEWLEDKQEPVRNRITFHHWNHQQTNYIRTYIFIE